MNDSRVTKIAKDTADVVLSMLPQLAGLLTPETFSTPSLAIAKVGSAIVGSKLQKFYNEFKEKESRGEIRANVESAQDSLMDLLETIEESSGDQKINAIKQLFFKQISPDTSEAEQQLIFEFIKICKLLSTNDLQVLKAAFEIYENGDSDPSAQHKSAWFNKVAKKIGHDFPSLVESSEKQLEDMKLIIQTRSDDRTYYTAVGRNRLTDLGYGLCQYLKVQA